MRFKTKDQFCTQAKGSALMAKNIVKNWFVEVEYAPAGEGDHASQLVLGVQRSVEREGATLASGEKISAIFLEDEKHLSQCGCSSSSQVT